MAWLSQLKNPQGTDANSYFADLRDRVSYIVNGPAGYAARRRLVEILRTKQLRKERPARISKLCGRNRKALEDRFPEGQSTAVALGVDRNNDQFLFRSKPHKKK